MQTVACVEKSLPTKNVDLLNIIINVRTKQKVAESSSDFCFVLIFHINLFFIFVIFCYILSHDVT